MAASVLHLKQNVGVFMCGDEVSRMYLTCRSSLLSTEWRDVCCLMVGLVRNGTIGANCHGVSSVLYGSTQTAVASIVS